MYRDVINNLLAWYEEGHNGVLYVKGAYGVGKTWTVKDFAKAYYNDLKSVDCYKNTAFKNIITRKIDKDNDEDDVSIETKISDVDFILEQHFGTNDFSDCLLIFDEIQNIPDAAEFFLEYSKAHPTYKLCLISSSMNVTEFEYTHMDIFNIIRMRPMTFEEFMIANKANDLLSLIENDKNKKLKKEDEEKVKSLLRDYMLTGGMPGVVKAFLKNHDYSVIKAEQKKILDEYEKRIRKAFVYAQAQRTVRIWTSVPTQLTRDNKKFMYRFVDENARAREYYNATQNLLDLGLVRKLPRVKECTLPLEDHFDEKSFELFMIDHGLLRTALNLDINDDLTLLDIFTEANGAIAEQYLFQELSHKVGFLYYWISGATARIPFVYESEDAPVPVDIRFTENKKAQNIKSFREKNKNTEFSLKISLEQVSLKDKVLNVPAYGIHCL
ncbi:MAG: AAA family ATPase [Lachnospiraceae bacterium]|nr:AAA family ATPase [Lachnospiraceae bacterium]